MNSNKKATDIVAKSIFFIVSENDKDRGRIWNSKPLETIYKAEEYVKENRVTGSYRIMRASRYEGGYEGGIDLPNWYLDMAEAGNRFALDFANDLGYYI